MYEKWDINKELGLIRDNQFSEGLKENRLDILENKFRQLEKEHRLFYEASSDASDCRHCKYSKECKYYEIKTGDSLCEFIKDEKLNKLLNK